MHSSLQRNGSFSTKFPGVDGRRESSTAAGQKLVRCPRFVLLMGKTQWERLRGRFGSSVGGLGADDPALLQMDAGGAHLRSLSFLDLSVFPIET